MTGSDDKVADDLVLADAGPKEKGAERRCILTRESAPRDSLVRLVLGPDGQLIVDVAAKLPGRGAWITPDRALIEQALGKSSPGKKNRSRKAAGLASALARAFKTQVTADKIPADLVGTIEALLLKRCLDRIGLENRAGHVRTGFDVIRMALNAKAASAADIMLVARDAARDSLRKIKQVTRPAPILQPFGRDELSKVLGKDNVVHALILGASGSGQGAKKLMADIRRLEGIRGVLIAEQVIEAPVVEETA